MRPIVIVVSFLCLSACLLITTISPPKRLRDRDAVWGENLWGQRNHVLDVARIHPREGALWGSMRYIIILLLLCLQGILYYIRNLLSKIQSLTKFRKLNRPVQLCNCAYIAYIAQISDPCAHSSMHCGFRLLFCL